MSEYGVVPPGYRTGCLPRTTKPGECCPLFGSRIKVIPRSDWATYTGKVSLRPFVREVLNQGRVGSCFPPGTMIRLANGGEKAIENISVLDEVVTAEGNVGKVTQVMARQHNDVILRLCINGSHHVRCTPEHPILTQRGYVPASELIKGDMVAFPKYVAETSKFIQTIDYVWSRRHTGARRAIGGKAGSVSYRCIPGKKAATYVKSALPDIIHLTEGFGRIIGLFLAEGSTSYGKAVYTFGSHEKDTLVAEIVGLLDTELGVQAAIQHRGTTIKVSVHGVHWAMFFEAVCGKLAGGKRLHPDFTAGPIAFLRGVLNGWCDGDGIGPNKNGGTTVSHSLALGMFDIANALGHKPTIRVTIPKLSHGVKSRQPIWHMEWDHGLIGKTAGPKTDYRKTQDDKCLWRRFESIEEEQYDGHVFNLEVEGDHSYVAEGIGVHNCASESSAQSVMIIRAFAGLPHISLNPYFVYHTVSGGRDQGSTIDSNLKFLRDVGCAPISVWSRDQGWQRKPSAEAVEAAKPFRIVEFYEIRTIEEMVTALFLGFPIVYGANGHAVVKIEHLNDREGLDINSWGTGWGDGGFGVWVPYRTLGSSLRYGAFAVRTSLQNDMLFDVERAAI